MWVAARDEHGHEVGFLASWPPDVEEPARACKIDERAIDSDGEPAGISLSLAPRDMSVPFDDLAVGQAIRRTLLLPATDVISTLMTGDARYVGAVTAARGDGVGRLAFDPFSRIFPSRQLDVGAGFFGTMPAPTGPVGQRYGSANPWPWDRFE